MDAHGPPPITDSPWLWLLLFSLVGLGALAAIHGKYGKRQAPIERQYQVRDRVADNDMDDPDRRQYSVPGATLIPLWPLAVGLGGAMFLAGAMLARERRGRGGGPPDSHAGTGGV